VEDSLSNISTNKDFLKTNEIGDLN